jgi:hypothetical protein
MNFKGKATWVGITFVVLVVVAIVALGAWRAKLHHEQEEAKAGIVTIYTCPMHPQVVSETSGKCPICGMDLIPIKRPKGSVAPAAPEAAPPAAPQGLPAGKE